VVNTYSLETYVKAGLDDEWIAGWKPEALKAGAIAYRSYGVYFVYHPASSSYDICDTTFCQMHDPTDTQTSTDSATDATTGAILTDSTKQQPFFAEYSAENNSAFCPDGQIGSPAKNWPCMVDATCVGKPHEGHGRGMCQKGTQRWALQNKNYEWIVNHYYNNDGHPTGARSGVLQQ
jgi:peptidoglycan hydrolase-like amidase